jgi:hypothetical protein
MYVLYSFIMFYLRQITYFSLIFAFSKMNQLKIYQFSFTFWEEDGLILSLEIAWGAAVRWL